MIAKLCCSFGYLTIALWDNDTKLRFVPHRIVGFYMQIFPWVLCGVISVITEMYIFGYMEVAHSSSMDSFSFGFTDCGYRR